MDHYTLTSLDDHSIMLKVKAGDVEKLGLLYHRYSRRLFGFFYRMTRDAAGAEDLVQVVFMRMLSYRHTYSDTGNFEAWAFHIARNAHKDQLKKNNRYEFREEIGDHDTDFATDQNQENHQIRLDELGQLKKALFSLTPEKREIIELTRFQKMKYDEVGKLLGISEGAVKVKVHRILKELKELYLKHEG